MKAGAILQKGETLTNHLREIRVDVTAFLDAAFQIPFVEVGEAAARVLDGALQPVTVATSLVVQGVDGVVDARAAGAGDLRADR